MSIRIKVILTIVLTAITIVVFGMGSGLVFVRGNLEKTIESDMAVVAHIADGLITNASNLLKADAYSVTQYLLKASPDEFQSVLKSHTEIYSNFIALTLFDRNGIVASYGSTDADGIATTPEEFIHSTYMQKAFAGKKIISTSQMNPNGELVFYVCVPMGERVLSATVPGLFFSKILSSFKIWETGNIFMLDAEGVNLANIRTNWVLERFNVIEKAKTDTQYKRVAETISRMIEGRPGSGTFFLDGKERLCVYTPITGSSIGWTLGVVAPIEESPLHDVRNGLLLVGVVCLLLSVIAALFASIILVRPYKTIEALLVTLEAQKKLLYTINDAATALLGADAASFESDIWKCMDMMARCAGIDRMRVWQNHTKDGELYCSQLYEWSGGAEPQAGKAITIDIPYSQNIPGWEEKLSSGQLINGHVRTFSPAEQAQISPQGILSILVIPVFFHERFWGFVNFDDCHKERAFSKDDENLLRSGGLLIANAILRNEMTHELVLAREEALASAAAKADFLANMSHEMRTPLNAIIGLSELALDAGEMATSVRDNLEKVYNAGVTLLSLINDILDISKIESGKFELIPIEYDTPSLINDTISLNTMRIGSKPITFSLDVDENLPSRLVGDELRVKQVFNNLLSNAFKYTKEGNVKWSIFSEQDSGGLWLVSRVTDSGVGIRPEDMEKLFSEYNQVDTKSNRKIEGTGLGLSICKSMVEMMGGWVSVESEYGRGSAFTVRMRQILADSTPIGAEVAENLKSFHFIEHRRDRSSKLSRAYIPYAKVLVVDDVPTNLDVARGMMNPYGMQIDFASSGPAAIEMIRNAKVTYNAIFMDHMMPGMDGIEATKIIRELGTEYAKNIPVIALTANAIVGNEDMFLENGFQAFLSKPIDIMRMDVVINHWVRNKELEKTLALDTNNGRNVPERRSGNGRRSGSDRRSKFDRRWLARLSLCGLDLEQGLRRFGKDEEIYLNVLISYAQNTPLLLDQLGECTEDKLANYAIVAHGIKSSSRSIGAEPIGAQAEALEHAAKGGDFAFVAGNNAAFIETVQTLLTTLSSILQDIANATPKPTKAEPDASLLAALLEASKSFDIDGVDKAMKELESYVYETRGELVQWLREQINIMGFKQITERLSQE